jgi:hypothetical protein
VSMTSVRQNLAAKFTDKSYRDAFVAEQIFSRLPLKMRCLREAQDLTQRQLGDLAGMKQTWVSKLEDPNYGKLTIATIFQHPRLLTATILTIKIIIPALRLIPQATTSCIVWQMKLLARHT